MMTLELLPMIVRLKQANEDQEQETMLNRTMKMIINRIRQKMQVKKRR